MAELSQAHVARAAGELQLRVEQVRATAALFADGATVPFIARYRKEVTGSLDEVAIAAAGPLLTLLQPTGYGVLRPLGLLFRNPLPVAAELRPECLGSRAAAGCAHEVLLTRLNSPGAVVLAVLPLLVLLLAAVAMLHGRRAGAVLAVTVNAMLAVLAAVYANLLPALPDPDQVPSGPALSLGTDF